jgi:hypothetical protein
VERVKTVVKNGHQLTTQKAAPEMNTNKCIVKLTYIEDLNVPSQCRDDIRTLQQQTRNQEKINLHRTFSRIARRT